MRIGAFELAEPVPELNAPHALTIIPYWMDAGRSASLTLSHLEQHFGGEKLASLARPGEFFDFTRYRPTLFRKEDASEVTLTNAVVTYGRRKEGCDFIFLRLPEPHAMAEVYTDSVVEILKTFGVKRYGLVGSIYEMVPYTRPLLVTGSASNQGLQNGLSDAKVVASDYEGPTTILHLLGQQMLQLGIETFDLVVHLPGYQTPENDYRGEKRLMEVIGSLYGLPVPQESIEKAKEQEEQFSQAAEQFLQQQPQLRVILKQLEENYDARVKQQKEIIRLSPEVEKFLKEMNGRFDQG
jgi:predicted ATP-grasp superfamily ATP-dependent carboligase